jgi:hypothetical protein
MDCSKCMADGHLEGRSTKPGDWAAYRVTARTALVGHDPGTQERAPEIKSS